MSRGYRQLLVYRRSMDVVDRCVALTHDLPIDERFELSSQIRRASVSIPANIAEGYARQTTGSYVYHLRVARGSATELEVLLEVADRNYFGRQGRCDDLIDEVGQIAAMITAIIRKLTEANESTP